MLRGTRAMQAALAGPPIQPPAPGLNLIDVSAVARLVDALGAPVRDGGHGFVIVEGGAGAGKSSALRAAATALASSGVRVLLHTARPGHGEEEVIRGLFGLHQHSIGDLLGDVLGSVDDVGPQLRALWRLALGAPAQLHSAAYDVLCERAGCRRDAAPSASAVGVVYGHRPCQTPPLPPVLIVEAAHVMPPAVLADLLSFAHLLGEQGLARCAVRRRWRRALACERSTGTRFACYF